MNINRESLANTTSPKAPPAIPYEIERAHQNFDLVAERFCRLEDRLTLVLAPEPVTSAEPESVRSSVGAVPDPVSPLEDRLQSLNRKLCDLLVRIQLVEARLGV